MSDENGNLIPFNELNKTPVDLNLAVNQAQQVISVLGNMGIVNATFDTGTQFQATPTVKTISNEGIMVQVKEHTTTVTFLNEGSSPREAITEVRQLTNQTNAGAFANLSQPSISLIENKSENNDH